MHVRQTHLIVAILDQVIGRVPYTVLYVSELDLVPLDPGASVGSGPVPHHGGGGAIPIGDARHTGRIGYRERELIIIQQLRYYHKKDKTAFRNKTGFITNVTMYQNTD